MDPTNARQPDNRNAATVLPDLLIAEFKNCTEVASTSSDGCYKFRIKNQGLGSAGGTTLRVDLVFDHGGLVPHIDRSFRSVTVPSLERGRDTWVVVPGPEACSNGCKLRYFTARLNPKDEIKESDKTNNTLEKMLNEAGPPPVHKHGKGTAVDSSQVPYDYYTWTLPEFEKSQGMARVQAGKFINGTTMYVCVAYMDDGEHPGKLYMDECYVPWNGKEYVFKKKESGLDHSNYEILLTPYSYYSWIPISQFSSFDIKKWAVEGGYVGTNSPETLYVCRMKLSDGVHPGKFLLSTGTCYVSWSGKELTFTKDFDVLKGL
jgi:hypothetical protein